MTHPTENPPVIVGVDGSLDAAAAVAWAAHEAARRGTSLRVIHTSPWGDDAVAAGRASAWDQEALRMRARSVLAEAVSHARDVEPDVPVFAELLSGQSPEALLQVASDASVVVVGRQGVSTVGTSAAGVTAALLAGHARHPVVVCGEGRAPSQTGGRSGPVVVGVDTCRLADCGLAQHRVLETAFSLAAGTSGSLVAVHAWSDVDLGADEVSGYVQDWEGQEEDCRLLLTELMAYWHDRYPKVSVRAHVVGGRPAHALVEAAATGAAVVVGSHGAAGADTAGVGSTTQRVLADARCPVIVVPPPVTSEVDR